MERADDEEFFQLVHTSRLPPNEKALFPVKYGNAMPLYRMRRAPTSLNQVDWRAYHDMAIWCDNNTVLCSCKNEFPRHQDRSLFFTFNGVNGYYLQCAIYGETDAVIAETATWFWSLPQAEEAKASLRIRVVGRDYENEPQFDFAALSTQQLAQILDANPTRPISFCMGHLSVEQSVILASRTYPLNLTLVSEGFTFLDGGTAFVDALANRRSSFGSLRIVGETELIHLSRVNLERLLQLEYRFEMLAMNGVPRESALLPFSTRVNALDYAVDAAWIQPQDLDSLPNTVARDLAFTLYMNDEDNWAELLISFFDRVAEVGHFERLTFSADYFLYLEDALGFDDKFEFDDVAPVVDAVIRAIRANHGLTYLNLGKTHWRVDWTPHLQRLFQSLEDHPGLRTFVVQGYTHDDEMEEEDDDDSQDVRFKTLYQFDFRWLEQLLSRNRHITVLNNSGKKCTNGTTIDALYALNRYYHQSASLIRESTSVRPILVSMVLTNNVSANFQYTALLLSHHTDMLTELVHGRDLDAAGTVGDAMEE